MLLSINLIYIELLLWDQYGAEGPQVRHMGLLQFNCEK